MQFILLLSIRADFLSSQKLLTAMLLQKKSIMQVLAANILMRISIVKIVCECFLPWQESRLKTPTLISIKIKHKLNNESSLFTDRMDYSKALLSMFRSRLNCVDIKANTNLDTSESLLHSFYPCIKIKKITKTFQINHVNSPNWTSTAAVSIHTFRCLLTIFVVFASYPFLAGFVFSIAPFLADTSSSALRPTITILKKNWETLKVLA